MFFKTKNLRLFLNGKDCSIFYLFYCISIVGWCTMHDKGKKVRQASTLTSEGLGIGQTAAWLGQNLVEEGMLPQTEWINCCQGRVVFSSFCHCTDVMMTKRVMLCKCLYALHIRTYAYVCLRVVWVYFCVLHRDWDQNFAANPFTVHMKHFIKLISLLSCSVRLYG